jgi:NADPH:quinone reductase-like Zn-dependent oxidoreductase
MEAAGVGSWDAAIREGSWRHPGRPKFPLVLGTDGAGIVIAKGRHAGGIRLGERVYGYEFASAGGGFCAEYATVKCSHVAGVPANLDPLEAGVSVPTGLTALQGLVGRLNLQRGQTVLIFGGSGAIGTFAVQFAKGLGARVIATASGHAAATLVRELGADIVIDARRDDVGRYLAKHAPNGFDVALALAGGDELERCLDAMRPGGAIAFPNGIEEGPPRRRHGIRRMAYDLVVNRAWLKRLNVMIAKAHAREPIAAVYSLSRATQAHRRLAQGRLLGRIALRVHRV